MTTTTKLTGRDLVKAANEFFADIPEDITEEQHAAYVLELIKLAGYTDKDEAMAELGKAIQEVQTSEAFTDDCLNTFNRDIQNFCALSWAPVKMTYMEGFTQTAPWGLMELVEARQQWSELYKRMVETQWGLCVVTQTRHVVCNWFAKWGNPDSGDFETRRSQLFEEWDEREKDAGGVDGDGKRLTVEVVPEFAPDTAKFQAHFAYVLAAVMATDSYLEDNKGDEEALAQWPIVEKAYNGDVNYVADCLQFITKKTTKPPYFDALLETFIPLISQSGRFKNINGLWAVRRLEELLETEVPEETKHMSR